MNVRDWTLRLRSENGFGLLELASGLTSREIHPNRAWIDGWNYESAVNRFRGVGDIDGDGRDEMVITSDWGIGILKHDGHHFRALMAAPRAMANCWPTAFMNRLAPCMLVVPKSA